MNLLQLILIIALVGFVCYLVLTYIPMPEPFKQLLVVVVVIAVIVWLIGALGVAGSTMTFPHWR